MNKIFEAVKKIPQTAEKEKWLITLDKDEGTLFYSPQTIPDGAELFQITDESAVYLDKNADPKGIMIEYYNFNFVEHHPEFKSLSDKIFGKAERGGTDVVVKNPEKKDGDVLLFKALLEKTIIAGVVMEPAI